MEESMKCLREEKDVAYKIFDISELQDMAFVIGESFSSSEAITVTQGISLSEMRDLVMQFAHKAAQESLTIVAQSQETKQIIGVLLANDFSEILLEEFALPTEKLNPILALMDELDSQYKYKQEKSIEINKKKV